MGQCSGRQQTVLDQQVQQEIEVDKQIAAKRFKLLLLGAGNSGKSTFFKQLCQIHGDGLDDDDKLHGARYIHDSIIHQMKNIIEACIDEFKYEVSSEAKPSLDFLFDLNRDQKITPDIAKHIKTLWADDAIKRSFTNRTNLGIVDSCPYFFDNIDRIGVNDYEPTEQDILLARIPTTGIRESTFKVEENTFDLFDVGGQRSERSKWIHCFDNVDAVLFVASLNCFDQNLFEDEDVNAMDESLGLFNEVINSRYFKKTQMILFLNKADLFEKKIQIKPLTLWDENYKGTPNSFEEGLDYIRDRFKAQNESEEEKTIYAHITTATNRENVQKVFYDVQHGIVIRALAINGLI